MFTNQSWSLPRFILLIIGILCMIQTLIAAWYSSFNFGVIFPAILGLPLIIWSVFYTKLQPYCLQGIGKMIKIFFITGYIVFILSFAVIASMIYRASHQKISEPSNAIVVLGAGLRGERVSTILAYRLDRAIEYLDESPDAIIVVSGGQGPQEMRSEADAMADYLIQQGVPADKIIKEDQSTTTRENFKFSKQTLDNYFADEPYTAVFVTSGFHVLRAELIAKKNDWSIQGLASQYDWLLAPNYYLREYTAIIHHWVTGNI